ncbi:MAG: hypothetical protein CBC55_02640 [Gammaproteobacteria bacterium TMED95]|uniref:Uncharacterized protein n=1 Tax=Alteromonas mediterranea TaxID=314275 RepID=A0AAC9JDM0_9ALTE|nr:hypothetical protein [Alteromonas mediterranea]APD91994.1 hypothetical protein BM524_18915 [Alteromonas mediterranea]APD99848.1 hypothetical protein BM525_19110 [Alteromonas mediterranea]OUV22957.1 MAG: hypothetical protein CBC55_02640 [Gammaproteobacteria bacterium TMED95]|tara:strand:+ start:4152 stop:4331 length:180 start_codon:yes stop_codon:yes gene_type:complete
MSKNNFDKDLCHDFVVSHGFGAPTDTGYTVAVELFSQGDDYATIGHELVARSLTTELSN